MKLLLSLVVVVSVCAETFAQQPRKQPERYPPGSYVAMLGDARVHYKSYGKGERALVFVHGWTCDQEVWRQQVAEFSKLTRVIAIDLPGHGESDKPQVNYTQDYFADAVDAVLRDAEVKKAVLVGHSMGTPVIRQFYRRHPSKTLGLVFVDGSLKQFFKKEDADAFIALLRGPQYRERATLMIDSMLATMADEQLRASVKRTMLSTPQHVAVSAMEGMNDPKVFAEDKIEVPALAVLAKSPFWPADIEQVFRRLAPRLEFRMWEGVGHFLMMERPQEFNKELTAFLSQNKLLLKRKRAEKL